MSDLKAQFEEPKKPDLMSPASYHQMLVNLVNQGTGHGKTEDIGVFKFKDFQVETLTSTGKTETVNTIKVEPLFMCLDTAQYRTTQVRAAVIEDTASNWAGKVTGKRVKEEEMSDFRGPGIWLQKESKIFGDYRKKNEDPACSLFEPDPDAVRVCLPVNQDINMPVQWGDFVVEAGGTVAIRERDMAGLVQALQDIKNGTPVEEALYTTDDKGATVAKFDIYGMEPGFLAGNYGPKTLKAETQKLQASAPKPKGFNK